MYSIVVCRLNDSTISGMAGVGAESISAPISFLTDMDRADMESAPTISISPDNFDRFWVQMVIKYNPGWE